LPRRFHLIIRSSRAEDDRSIAYPRWPKRDLEAPPGGVRAVSKRVILCALGDGKKRDLPSLVGEIVHIYERGVVVEREALVPESDVRASFAEHGEVLSRGFIVPSESANSHIERDVADVYDVLACGSGGLGRGKVAIIKGSCLYIDA